MTRSFRIPLLIACIYALFGSLWVYVSDDILFKVTEDSIRLTRLATLKGLSYVAFTTFLLYYAVRVPLRKLFKVELELKSQKKELEMALARMAEEKAKTESIIAGIADGISIHDADYRIIYQNEALQNLLGNHVGKHCFQAYRGKTEVCGDCVLGDMFRDGKTRRIERTAIIGNKKFYLDNTVSPIRNAEGNIVAGLELIRDVTDRRNSDEKLRTTQEFLANLMELVPMPIYVTGTDGKLRMVNDAWEKFTGISREEAVASPIGRFFQNEVAQQFMRTEPATGDGTLPVTTEQFVNSGAGRQYFHTVKFPLHDSAGCVEAVGGILVDITERKRFEEQLVYQATHDYLTGLPNRNLLHERLDQALEFEYHNKGLLALLLLDLDNFKMINDTFGHPAGDLLLKDVADKLKHNLRQYDTFARLGGDEFVILIRDTERNLDIGRIAARILSMFDHPITLKGQEVFVTASIGIAMFPEDGESGELLLRNADAAMFHAKKKGKNNYQFFTEAINADVHERLAMETKLRRALEREEFSLHYQPRIEMSSGRISGMEALLRWQPDGGKLVSPAEFIPLLEETGLIVPVEEWVLRTACSQAKAWQDAGMQRLRLAVNISARHFSQENLPDKISQILFETGLEAESLEIELTESIIMKDVAESVRKLDALKRMGVTFSIDDFGTGYSSLSYLKRFPIDVLKIDRSFVDGIPHDSSDTTIATTVIAMAHNLNMSVVAEGVETMEQLAFLAENSCDEYQGFYFSKPLTAPDFARFLTTRKPVMRHAAT
ncbi:bifunctional diguanylate cyclase/phosphodiesterase [Geobacter sp. DSM 9736]|uniref:sensor domain-containing protein n=1 Tax=Geobacter sp. DSM 9736 TaxID=1277350 RepID=UPI00155FD4D4|nr:bifunctional diguanylate cyclase/phosphodiesterase [Geobacter sp. DSM 9736]